MVQVHSLRTGFTHLRQGVRTPYTNSESSTESLLTPPGSILDPVHFRGESVPSLMPGYSPPTAAKFGSSVGRVNPSNTHLLDPLVDFSEEELETHPARLVRPVDNFRVSMQWWITNYHNHANQRLLQCHWMSSHRFCSWIRLFNFSLITHYKINVHVHRSVTILPVSIYKSSTFVL